MHGTPNFTFNTFLSGISKSLGVAREIIPLWQQTRPLINNARKAYNLIKQNGNKKEPIRNNRVINIKKAPEKKDYLNSNNPQFFL